jgi:Protein of unknown function (DUF1569)
LGKHYELSVARAILGAAEKAGFSRKLMCMAKTLWDSGAIEQLLTRFQKLTPQTSRQWGKMTASQMVKHCVEPLRGLLGETDVPSRGAPAVLRMFPMKQLIIFVFPFPKGAPTAPEFVIQNEPDLESSREELAAVLERARARGMAGEYKAHPAFGKLNGKAVGALTYKHLDHHLRQFGM